MDNGGQTETQNSDGEGTVTENISGAASFEAAVQEHDPMRRLETKPAPEGVPEKFWDAEKGVVRTDALLKSYGELETKLGQTKPAEEASEESEEVAEEAAEEETPEETEAEAEEAAEETEEEPSEEAKAPALADAITSAQAYFQENGDLPADARKDLHALGIDDAVIDLQIQGAKAYRSALEHAAAKAAGVEDYGEVEKAIAWATENWSEKKILAFNAQSGDVETIGLAVTALFKDYSAAEPGEGRLTNINSGANRGDVFTHKDEFSAALKAADDLPDPAARRVARRAVIEKQNRSLKAGTVKR